MFEILIEHLVRSLKTQKSIGVKNEEIKYSWFELFFTKNRKNIKRKKLIHFLIFRCSMFPTQLNSMYYNRGEDMTFIWFFSFSERCEIVKNPTHVYLSNNRCLLIQLFIFFNYIETLFITLASSFFFPESTIFSI